MYLQVKLCVTTEKKRFRRMINGNGPEYIVPYVGNLSEENCCIWAFKFHTGVSILKHV
jgi:hypothetical protein